MDLGDLHCSEHWAFSRLLPNGLPSRFQELLDVLKQVEVYLERHQVEDLILGGDLLHRRHFIRFKLYNPLYDALHRLAERVRQTIIFVGNHDMEDDATHGLHAFSGLPNTLVIDTPQMVSLADGQADAFILPWHDDPAVVIGALDKAPTGALVLGHYGAEGCPLATDYYLEAPLKLGELARFSRVLFNHIHVPSEQLGGKVVYVGAVAHFDFGDQGPRSCVRLTGSDYAVQRLPLNAPQFVTAAWPRTPLPTSPGYLRLMDVPAPRLEEAKAAALKAGWLDVLALEAKLPDMVRAAVLEGMIVGEAMLVDYVRRKCPGASPEEQAELVREGMLLLEATRR